MKRKASETEKALEAVYKQFEAEKKKKDEAKREEATQSDQQQQCI